MFANLTLSNFVDVVVAQMSKEEGAVAMDLQAREA